MNDHLVEKVWRVRMKYSPEEKDYSSTAWKHGEVGIWYGAWSVEDFEEARNRKEGSIEDHLNRLPTQRELIRLNAQATVRKREIDTVKRFFGIASNNNEAMSENDWVVVCSDDDNETNIHLGRLKGSPKNKKGHALNLRPSENAVKEFWKFREVIDRKSFRLSALPDFYRLIPQYGRQGNIFQFRGNYLNAINVLVRCRNVAEVQNEFKDMTLDQRLNLMGPEIWEALCLGYLIRVKNFVPTGVSVGGTLKNFDMVGCNWEDGAKIYAQCKKDQDPKEVEEGFYSAASDVKRVNPNAIVYYFPYGACHKN